MYQNVNILPNFFKFYIKMWSVRIKCETRKLINFDKNLDKITLIFYIHTTSRKNNTHIYILHAIY